MEDEFAQFDNLIRENFLTGTSDKSEAATKILKYKSRIEYLPFLQEFLERFHTESIQHLVITFNFMREIVKLRGCLLSPDELNAHFMFLKQFILNNRQMLISNPVIIQSATQDLAYTTRITIEQDYERGHTLIDEIKEFFNSQETNLQVVALYAMTSLVDCFKEPLSCDTFIENNTSKKGFEQTYLHIFTECIHPLILEGTGQILFSSLGLLLHCFEFFENPNKTTVSINSFQGCFALYFSPKSGMLQRIIGLCMDQDAEIVNLSYKILTFMASASNEWNTPADKIEYYDCFCAAMIDIINSQDENSANIGQISIILNLLGENLNGELFFEKVFAQQFLNSALRFSCIVFTKTEPPSLHNIFIFWSKISNYIFDPEFFRALVNNFIDFTLNSIAQNGEDWATLFTTEYINSGFESIWKIAHSCYEKIFELIIGKIESVSSENPINLLQLTFLTMIVSSSFGRIPQSDAESKAPFMYRRIIMLIEQTNSMIKQIFTDPTAPIFENSLVIFMNNYQNSYFSGSKITPSKTEQQKDEDQNNINIFVSRILNEFDSFSFVCASRNLVERIFELVECLVTKDDCRELISNTPIKDGLLYQSLSISFEGVPPDVAKRPRIRLYYLYASLINSVKELQIFLGKFDVRFQEVASSNYSDQAEIFALFCDLRGVFKYLLRNINKSSAEDIRKKYIRVCNWFSTEHVQDSIEIIKNNSSNPYIVNIVCSVWISLFPDRFDQQKKNTRNQPSTNIDNFDGFGIILFKTMLLIADTVFQSCSNDFDKYCILFKVIRYCITTKYTNFGVMSYYGDDSFNQMSKLFFHMVSTIDLASLDSYMNVLNNILLTMSAITGSEKCLNELFENEDKTNLGIIVTFTEKCMNLDSHNRDEQGKEAMNRNFREAAGIEKKSISNRDLWETVWKVLQPILAKAITAPESVKLFRPHSILVLNSAMMKYDKKEINLGPILLASFAYDDQFVKWLMDLVVGSYDERFQQYVKDQFMALFSDPMTEPIFDNFVKRLDRFSLSFKKYQNDFIDIPDVAQYL